MLKILQHFFDMLPPMLAAFPLAILWRLIRRRSMHHQGLSSSLLREGAILLFSLFCVGLAAQTLTLPISWENGQLIWNKSSHGSVNFIPFRVLADTWRELQNGRTDTLLISFLGNFVMFLPIGFFPCLCWRGGNWKRALLIGTVVSFCIELCQLPLPRATDIDDLWMNLCGAMLGYGCYHLLQTHAPKLSQHFLVNEFHIA